MLRCFKKMLKSIKGNNKDTFFLASEKNIERGTLKQSKQTSMLLTTSLRRTQVEMRAVRERMMVREKRGSGNRKGCQQKRKVISEGEGWRAFFWMTSVTMSPSPGSPPSLFCVSSLIAPVWRKACRLVFDHFPLQKWIFSFKSRTVYRTHIVCKVCSLRKLVTYICKIIVFCIFICEAR